MRELRSDYAEMKPMIFGDFPPWDEIIRGLTQLEERINGGKYYGGIRGRITTSNN